jgi:hypothetical protein
MRGLIVPAISLSLALMACSNTTDLAPGEDAEAFVGTDSCDVSLRSDERLDDGTREIREHFSCTLETSDERATGTHELDTVTVIQDAQAGLPGGAMWWLEEDVITTDGGTWRATDGYGVVDLVGVHPMAENVKPFNYGVQRYVGENGYSGLKLTIVLTGSNESVGLAGWIEDG